MKHTWPVTAALVLIFVATQLVGLALINRDIEAVEFNPQTGQYEVTHQEQTESLRPQTTGAASFLYLVFGVLVGTVLILVLMRFRQVRLWRLWFFSAVVIAITVALAVVLDLFAAFVLALVLGIAKIWRPNLIVHNATEILMYSGIGVLLIPIFSLWWAVALLLLISIYDMIAVWRSRHMVKMAAFQTDSKVFAGLMIPYGARAGRAAPRAHAPGPPAHGPAKGRTAILGGGDVAFPLIFAGVVMERLIQAGYAKAAAYGYALFIVAGATLALLGLFLYAKKDKFYPAMPFLSAGCFAGAALLWTLL